MFETLTERMGSTLRRLRGRGRLSDANMRDALREVRMALIEADVALEVVGAFTERVREKVLGQEVRRSLSPDQEVVRAVRDELCALMGEENAGLALNVPPPAVILVAGLQGSGKTTTVAKLSRWLREEEKRKVLVASCDVYRPAAIEQLRVLAAEAQVDFFPSHAGEDPVDIVARARSEARRRHQDVLVLDTAGRMHVDADMMDEVRRIHHRAEPVETLFVVDSMTGQDAATVARAFDRALPLSGVVLTKTDGDARGGAALSIRHITGKPIKFLGTGEKLDGLQAFHPDRMASRILGMGDVLGLIEEAERKIDRSKAQKFADKFAKGKRFDLEDFGEQDLAHRRVLVAQVDVHALGLHRPRRHEHAFQEAMRIPLEVVSILEGPDLALVRVHRHQARTRVAAHDGPLAPSRKAGATEASQPRSAHDVDHVFDFAFARDAGAQERVAAVFLAVRIEGAVGRNDRMDLSRLDCGEDRAGARMVDVAMPDLRGRRAVAATHARRAQHPKLTPGAGFELAQQCVRAHQLAGQAVAHPHRQGRRRSRIFADRVEMGVESGGLVDLRHRHAHLLGQRRKVGGRQVSVAILHQVQVLDQQIAPPRPVADQGADFVMRLGAHLASLGHERPAASPRPRVPPFAHPYFLTGHVSVLSPLPPRESTSIPPAPFRRRRRARPPARAGPEPACLVDGKPLPYITERIPKSWKRLFSKLARNMSRSRRAACS